MKRRSWRERNEWAVFLCYRDQGSVHETELQPGVAMRAKQGRKRGILRVPGILSEFRGSRGIEPRLRHRWDRLSVSVRDEQGRLRQGCQYHDGVPGEMRWVLEKFQKKYFDSLHHSLSAIRFPRWSCNVVIKVERRLSIHILELNNKRTTLANLKNLWNGFLRNSQFLAIVFIERENVAG